MGDLHRVTVGISEMRASTDPDSYLITHSLGSCIGLVAYDRRAVVGALLHFQLPDSVNHDRQARDNPCMFADTGIPLLVKELAAMGAHRSRIAVSMFGGANMLDDNELFKIGTRNARATRKILWQHAISIHSEDVGGSCSRTVSLDVATGVITVKRGGKLFQFQ